MKDSKLRKLPECDRQDNDADGDQDNPKQIAIGNASRGKIALRLTRTLGQLGEVFIVQLADGLKKRSNCFFVGLTRLGRPRGVFVQVA